MVLFFSVKREGKCEKNLKKKKKIVPPSGKLFDHF